MRVIALASGSSGNATLVKTDQAAILIDVGVPARVLERALKHFATDPRAIAAVFLTHEHTDHVAAAGAFARRHGLTVIANEQTLSAAPLGKVHAAILRTGDEVRLGDLRVGSFALPHDAREPVGYRVEHDGTSLCLATDLGHVPTGLRETVRAADLVILEANHDPVRLKNGPYPAPLKARILGWEGHLSNQQAADCIVASASGRPQWLWLAHLSDVNNSPAAALRTVTQALSAASITSVRTTVALRDRPSVVWDSKECFTQGSLFAEMPRC